MWQTIYNWPWATIWSAISAFFTAFTAVVAYWAILRWSKQEELKVKMAFKNAVCDYAYQLALMPDILFTHEGDKYEKEYTKLNALCAAAIFAYAMTEGLLSKKQKVLDAWNTISNHNATYIAGRCKASELLAACDVIIEEPILFK